MGFRELEYVRALAEYRSITKAAKAVGLTQPAMSMFLRSLEGQLGAPLFERVGKGLILTCTTPTRSCLQSRRCAPSCPNLAPRATGA